MTTQFTVIDLFAAIASGFVAYILGGINGLVIAFFIFTISDFMTGIAKAVITKKLNSSKGFIGILKLCLKWLLVIIANVIDYYIIGDGELIRTAVLLVMIANEGISIIENLHDCGLHIPNVLIKYFERLKGEHDDSNDL